MKVLLTTVLGFFCACVFAQNTNQVVISLKVGGSIPSIDDVIQEAQLSPPPANHLIAAFDAARPADLEYLVPIRAYGDLKVLIDEKPNWNRAVFERSLMLSFDVNADMVQVEAILTADQFIASVSVIEEVQLAASDQSISSEGKSGNSNWHLTAINWAGADNLTAGYGNIGFIDTGSLPDRVEFTSFDPVSGDFIGGGLNVSKGYSTFYQDRDISELREINENLLANGTGTCDDFDSNPGDGLVIPAVELLGHGTHVSGLLGSRSDAVPGVCSDCFLSGIQEVRHTCQSNEVRPIVDLSFYPWSLSYLMSTGVQTISMSFGSNYPNDQCIVSPNFFACLFIADAKARNVALVAAAGNHRESMTFPASDRAVIGVSGIQSDLQFWNEAPTNGENFPPLDPAATQNTDGCPFYVQPSPVTDECGSNYSWLDEVTPGVFVAERYRRIDVAAPARDVMSTIPLGSEYIPQVGDAGCTDMADGVLDGYGPCTGTSMSTPIVAGLLQMIRSVNPLLPIGDDDPTILDGVRDVLLYSGSEFQSSREHNPWLGFGIPDAQIAVETVLGKSNGQLVKNRVTPLMVLHNETFNDTTYTVFPQIALAHALNPPNFYENPIGIPAVAELTQYPVEEVDGEPLIELVPLAPIYVFTTKWNPLTQSNTLIPLYRMNKETLNDPDCFPGRDDPVSCFVTGRKTIMVTDEAELESFHTMGFELQGIEGYLIPCADELCNTGPAGKIYRAYDAITDNYYLTQLSPPPGSVILGAGFLNFDFDGDGLTVGMEYLLGTSDSDDDSDDDGLLDGFEYPAAGVPFSDPLVSDIIFEDGFE
ncbi:hypothetical protein MNBD_GAMMA02-896 [hydrothermal vent metagenome]|uniref:Peptidase S8/S53 domain-containing protein n=1 Tax=hydrothermal vent metagenome TaxID=652676 RepID=A0A3B0VVQ8_9ZZZZ